MSTYLDYIGRTLDVSIFRGELVNSALTMELFGDDGGQVCAGIQKLAQRWVLEFFTEVGSMPYALERGAAFLTAARNGLMATELDVYQTFNLDADNIRRALVNEELDTDPDDERFASADLESVTLSPGFLTVDIALTSRAGTSRSILLPIPLAI